MSAAEPEKLIRDRLAARDKAIAGHLFRSDTFQWATDQFVSDVLAAAATAATAAAAKPVRPRRAVS